MKLSAVAFRRVSLAVLMMLGSLIRPLQADTGSLTDGDLRATVSASDLGRLRSYLLTTNAELRDKSPADKRVTFAEIPGHAWVRTGSVLFDGLYALAVNEALQDSVSQIQDGSYNNNRPVDLEAFQTGAKWTYVWTRDLSYSTHLALAQFDPGRAMSSLLFKTSTVKPTVSGKFADQIIQDTGSGGSYPVSTDRVVWSLGAAQLLRYLPASERQAFLRRAYPVLRDTLEQDRRLVFDPQDGLYRGEQSFLDWREQTYPLWTRDNVLPIAMSKALSVNVADYFALRTAAEFAADLGRGPEGRHYGKWASDLKRAVNRQFFDTRAGLYSTYLLTDTASPVRAHRYDLLGESLAILLGVAPDDWAKRIIRSYPAGRYGPPVVWPQEHDVPIYHNHAIWPFVTAYWIKAARQVGNAEVVDRGIFSLMRGAAFNLSNMENLDVATGKPSVTTGALQGPVINSQRQLWSVAGYLSMVQDVIFGLETCPGGIRFRPFVTTGVRGGTFASTSVLQLHGLGYQGKTIDVSIHLPPAGGVGTAAYRVVAVRLNGRKIGPGFVAADSLPAHSLWDIDLGKPAASAQNGPPARTVDVLNPRALFAPAQPEWQDIGQGGITCENGRLTLHYGQADPASVVFNIYRDGRLCAKAVRATQWTDPRSGDFAVATRFYNVEAEDQTTGNASHLAPTRHYEAAHTAWFLPAKQMRNQGGNLVNGHHFENWGRPQDQLWIDSFTAERSGRYLVRAEYANGAGPINTGITCAVKKLEISRARSHKIVASEYLVMPQLGDWKRFVSSSVIRADLQAGETYTLRISEDAYSRNMSYFSLNRRYTGGAGGGDAPYNFVNIAGLDLLHVAN